MISSPIIFCLSLLLSLPLIFFFLSPRLKLPISQISPADELSDLSLFRRATAHRSISRLSTTNPKPKIAFLFLTNTPLHFAPLWEKYFTQNTYKESYQNTLLYNIYVHADPSANVPSPGGVFSGRFIPAKKTTRGTPTLISAARRLLATAILDDPLNYYFTLVSQHCVPLHSFAYTHKTLFSNKRSGPSQLLPSRLSYIEILSGEPQLEDRYNARGPHVMLPEIKFDDFRVGSQFFTLTRKHAMTVLKDSKLWNKFKLPCLDADTCYAEEHYFPTLLNMVDPAGCSKYTLTNVNWTDSTGGHPYMYIPDEINAGWRYIGTNRVQSPRNMQTDPRKSRKNERRPGQPLLRHFRPPAIIHNSSRISMCKSPSPHAFVPMLVPLSSLLSLMKTLTNNKRGIIKERSTRNKEKKRRKQAYIYMHAYTTTWTHTALSH